MLPARDEDSKSRKVIRAQHRSGKITVSLALFVKIQLPAMWEDLSGKLLGKQNLILDSQA